VPLSKRVVPLESSPSETPAQSSLRVPLRIRLPFASADEFLERYGDNVSERGIFILTRSPKPLRTLLSFELVLSDGVRLMRGEAEVTQVREAGQGQGQPAGMNLQLTRIDSKTKALLDRVLLRSRTSEPAPIEVPPLAESPVPAGPLDPAPEPAIVTVPQTTKVVNHAGVLGVDFGTTSCRVSVIANGQPLTVAVTETNDSIPTVARRRSVESDWLVGAEAEADAASPLPLIRGFKRMLGRRARSKSAQQVAQRLPFRLAADSHGDFGIPVDGDVVPLTVLASQVFAALKKGSTAFLGAECSRAVLATPAYFNDHQRQALIESARLAGFEVLRLINEPTAVALAFAAGRSLARKRVLVYDLGGGTFDVSIVEMTGDDVEVVSAGGDSFLGGADFDSCFTEALLVTLSPEQQQVFRSSEVLQGRLLRAAEQAKVELSNTERTSLHLLPEDSRPESAVKLEIERSFFEAAVSALVERTVNITKAVLDAAKLTPSQLDEVLLVGGQSRAPVVRQRLTAFFGRAPRVDIDAQGAVAAGAALLGNSMLRVGRGQRGSRVTEVLTASIGLSLRGGAMRKVLERGTGMPTKKALAVPVSHAGPLTIGIFQGESALAAENDVLGSYACTVDRPQDIEVAFAVGHDGQLTIEVRAASGKVLPGVFVSRDFNEAVQEALFREAPTLEAEPHESGLFRGLRRLFKK
jgi:molecular chaperone DnaK